MNKPTIGKNLQEFRDARSLLEKMDRINTAIEIIRRIINYEEVEWDKKGNLVFTIKGEIYIMEIKEDEYLLKVRAYTLIKKSVRR